jgi:tetratricopeptide (TPR) repeat protein
MESLKSIKVVIILLVALSALLAQATSNDASLSESYNAESIKFIEQGDFLQAYQYANLAREQSIFTNDQIQLGYAFKNLATSFYFMADYNTALNYYQQSLSIFESLADIENQVRLLSNQANVYSELNNYDVALELEEKAIALIENTKDQHRYNWLYINYAYDLGKAGAYVQSVNEYKKLESKLSADSDELVYLLIQKAEIHRINQDYSTALQEINRAKQISQNKNLHHLYYSAILEQSKSELERLNFSAAVELASEAAKYFKQKKLLSKLATCYQVLAQGHEFLQEYQTALSYVKQQHQLIEQTQNIRTKHFSKALAIEKQLKDQRELIKELKNKQQKREQEYIDKISMLSWIMLTLAGLNIVLLFVVFIRFRRKND